MYSRARWKPMQLWLISRTLFVTSLIQRNVIWCLLHHEMRRRVLKAMLHGAIFLATCNAIILLRDVKLPNTSLHYTPLMFSQHIENYSLISLINISQE
jgi:hypothetical protein